MATINFDRVALYANLNQAKIIGVQRTYGGRVRVQFDQENCTFHLESRCPELTTREVVEAFGLTTFRDYFASCAERRRKAMQ